MKYWSYLRDKQGMTFVEIIVATAIFVIIITLVSLLLVDTVKVFNKGAQMNESDQLGDAVFSFIEDSLDDALGVELVPAGEAANAGFGQLLHLADSHLYYDKGDGSGGFAIFDEAVYGGRTITYTVTISSDDIFFLQVIILNRDGSTAYIKDSNFRLMNVSMGAGMGVFDRAGGLGDPLIYFEQN